MEIISTTLISFFASLLLHAAADAPLRPQVHLGCVQELVLFSPCLPYVSASPNNLTAEVTPQCCAVFLSATDNGSSNCLCYLLRQPLILGFPLDIDKVVSLPRLCSRGGDGFSLEALCSPEGTPVLPPLDNVADVEVSDPSDSGDEFSNPSSSISLPPESDAAAWPPEPAERSLIPPPYPVSATRPERDSTEAIKLGWPVASLPLVSLLMYLSTL